MHCWAGAVYLWILPWWLRWHIDLNLWLFPDGTGAMFDYFLMAQLRWCFYFFTTFLMAQVRWHFNCIFLMAQVIWCFSSLIISVMTQMRWHFNSSRTRGPGPWQYVQTEYFEQFVYRIYDQEISSFQTENLQLLTCLQILIPKKKERKKDFCSNKIQICIQPKVKISNKCETI